MLAIRQEVKDAAHLFLDPPRMILRSYCSTCFRLAVTYASDIREIITVYMVLDHGWACFRVFFPFSRQSIKSKPQKPVYSGATQYNKLLWCGRHFFHYYYYWPKALPSPMLLAGRIVKKE